MSIQAVGWALDFDIEPRAKMVFMAICNHADHTNGYCYLRADTIAREGGCNLRSVPRYIGALIRNGYMRKELRRGADGKQRATDYWVLMDRGDRPDWDRNWRARKRQDEDDEADPEIDEQQDVDQPPDSLSVDKVVDEIVDDCNAQRSESGGPVDSGVHRERIEEPSKTKPEKDARESRYTPRHYRAPPPPPPEIQGAVVADKQAKQIFVFKNSRAGDAWVEYKRITTGIPWHLWRWHWIAGVGNREGWWFPSLFPPPLPASHSSTDPPKKTWQQEIEEMSEDFK